MPVSSTKSKEFPDKIGIVFSDFGPYHAARIEALAISLKIEKATLWAFRFSENSSTYKWTPVIPSGVNVITLISQPPRGIFDAYRIAKEFKKEIKKQDIEAIFLPSYFPFPNLFCLITAKFLGCKTILMSESWLGSEKKNPILYFLKHLLVRQFNAALVGGTPQKKYVCKYGQKISKVFIGYDVIDVEYFAAEANKWRKKRIDDLPFNNFPPKYFLYLGRFTEKKNVRVLIKAYANVFNSDSSVCIPLVLVGDGDDKKALIQLARKYNLPTKNGLDLSSMEAEKGGVIFYPFQQIELTPLFYSRCEAFILPSYYEEWGLVVNEAMACRAAVLVSSNSGCIQDLLIEGVNGFHFDPSNFFQLSILLKKFILDPTLSFQLGTSASKHVKNWGTGLFAQGAVSAIKAISQKKINSNI